MQVAVVGSGLAGFTAYQTLRRELAPGEIAVFGTDADPAAAWRVRAAAIRQREMRSESDGHCLPTSFPGLAFSSVRRRRSVRPLLDSVLDALPEPKAPGQGRGRRRVSTAALTGTPVSVNGEASAPVASGDPEA